MYTHTQLIADKCNIVMDHLAPQWKRLHWDHGRWWGSHLENEASYPGLEWPSVSIKHTQCPLMGQYQIDKWGPAVNLNVRGPHTHTYMSSTVTKLPISVLLMGLHQTPYIPDWIKLTNKFVLFKKNNNYLMHMHDLKKALADKPTRTQLAHWEKKNKNKKFHLFLSLFLFNIIG